MFVPPRQVEPFPKVEAPSCSQGRHAIFHRVICVSMKGYTAYPARIPWNSLIFVGILAENRFVRRLVISCRPLRFRTSAFQGFKMLFKHWTQQSCPKQLTFSTVLGIYNIYTDVYEYVYIYIIYTTCSLRLHIQRQTRSLCWHACMESHASQSCHVHYWSKAIHVILSRPKWSAARWKIHNTFTMRFAHLAKNLWKLPSYDSWIDKNGVFGDPSALCADTLLRYCVGAFFARTGAFGPKHATS